MLSDSAFCLGTRGLILMDYPTYIDTIDMELSIL